MTSFLKLNSDGTTTMIKKINQSDILKCNFAILSPDHYREDGTCKCDDRDHRKKMIKDWGYESKDFIKIPLRNK